MPDLIHPAIATSGSLSDPRPGEVSTVAAAWKIPRCGSDGTLDPNMIPAIPIGDLPPTVAYVSDAGITIARYSLLIGSI